MRVSVVISTYNRTRLLIELLDCLGKQTLAPSDYEVIVVDDGSKQPAEPELKKLAVPYPLRVVTQQNGGAAAARHRGIMEAKHEIIVITDDDMLVPPEFLAEHRAAHEAGFSLVLGHIGYDDAVSAMPLFERFHVGQLRKFVEKYREQPTRVNGTMVCTGNVSFRRQDYLDVGGFDRSLGRSEDRELGIRLQTHGAKLTFAYGARTTNRTDHTDFEVWMKRNFLYGVFDSRIAKKYPDNENADPWHFLLLVNPVSAGLLLLSGAAPTLGKGMARSAFKLAKLFDALGKERVALAGTTLVYGLEYFRGVREEAGSLRGYARGLKTYIEKRQRNRDHRK